MNKIAKGLIYSGLALGVIFTSAGCSVKSDPDQILLHYKDGPTDQKKFSSCVAPGSSGGVIGNDKIITLPVNLRTWNIQKDGSGDTKDPIQSGSKPLDGGSGPQINVFATAEFVLNTDCSEKADSPVVKFWETIGRNYQADTPNGWLKMLKNTVVPSENAAFASVTREFIADDLVYDTNGTDYKPANAEDDVWTQVEKKVSTVFTSELKSRTGGYDNFFCNPSFRRTDPVKTCGTIAINIVDVDYTNPAIQDARDKVRTTAETAKAALIEAQNKVDVANKTAQAAKLNKDYVELQVLETQLKIAQACASSANCTMVVPNGTGVNVTTK